ncbi:hypothetical protein CTheo_6245 [Ceratobasidium theobromae]|uniref:Uncharacterized protein n=1 Tax=Ceratobasidium theobromae TaxID=1582974 RepID=A0A5N5QG81_9AGAM|nr:hypothetical protein CTheo_6245 [Ceratobasidium theobromae]
MDSNTNTKSLLLTETVLYIDQGNTALAIVRARAQQYPAPKMSEPPPVPKQSSTIILIGDEASRKSDLLLYLYAVGESKPLTDYYTTGTGITLPPPSRTGNVSALYTISRSNGAGATRLGLTVLSTPDLDQIINQAQVQAINADIKNLTPTVDAILIVLDRSQKSYNPNLASIINGLSETFPRSLVENISFLSMNNNESIPIVFLGNLAGLGRAHNQIIILNMVLQGRNTKARLDKLKKEKNEEKDFERKKKIEEEREDLRKEFEEDFKQELGQLQSLWEFVDSRNLQACDMKELYRKGIRIEAQISTALAEKKGAEVVKQLVHEYSLLAKSPDFSTHVTCMFELLNANKGSPGVQDGLQTLESIHTEIRRMEESKEKFPKGFTVCDPVFG